MEKILVVDDNRQIADFLAYKVLPNLGYQAVVAYCGENALEILREQHQQLSLVILDWQLPDMTGLDILRTMKESNFSLPTIIITGEGSEEVAVDALRLGVQDYLLKPVDADALSEAIDRALEKNRLRCQKVMLTARLKNQLSWLSELSKIGRTITSALALDEVLQRVIDSAVELVQADQGSISLLERLSEHLYLRAVRMSSHSEIQSLRVPINIHQFSQVLMSKKPVKGVGNQDATLRDLIHLPIISKGEASGVLSISRHGSGEFTSDEEAKLVSLTDYAAIAITNAMDFERAQNGFYIGNQTSDMQRAIEQNELVLHYQPIVSFGKKELVGFEALVRWVHPERGILSPGEFIPSAEESGLIFDIDRWVLQQACEQLCEWQKASIADPSLSVNVNINADHLCGAGFLEYVEEILRDTRLSPSNLKIEITERSIVEQTDTTVDLINELLGLGI
ncbi:MAG: EAL domain-containing protein [Anaerolineales bacterium]|nr:EAL domain-containing protein [Anaerolineales bacterium]